VEFDFLKGLANPQADACATTMTTEKKRLRIGILFGGRSGEHEVSLLSAASVISALDPEKYEAVPIGISKDGRWLAGTAAHKMLPALGEVLRTGESVMLRSEEHTSELQSQWI
jgi:D-alanine-D-alanine ligase-like ATP-grasp enzyme